MKDQRKTKKQLIEELTALRRQIADLKAREQGGEDLPANEAAKQLEQLYHTARLVSISELVAGVAHEINNPLTSVLGYSELLLAADLPPAVKEDLEVIHQDAERVATEVRHLLALTRKPEMRKESTDVNSIVKQCLEMRRYHQKRSGIEVITEFAPELPSIMADPQQLQQVFLNIILNAEEAMLEAHGRGTLTVRTEARGDMIRVSLADNGPGIPPENLRQVFDRFFTTKEAGKGIGLGLAVCQGIVTAHGGRIYAESEPGKGATIFVELPMAV